MAPRQPQRSPSQLELPMAFEENRGQFPAIYRYKARPPSVDVYFARDSVLLRSGIIPSVCECRSAPPTGGRRRPAARHCQLFYRQPSESWKSGIPTYGRVRYPESTRIDAVFYGNGKAAEYDFIVQPGGSSTPSG